MRPFFSSKMFSNATWLAVGLLIAGAVFAQGSNSFSWDAVLMNDGTVHNYTTPITSQPYQGPCMAFAFSAAVESMYEIENANPNLEPDLSQAWLDYSTWGSSAPEWKGKTEGVSFPGEACGNFPLACQHEPDCHLLGDVEPFLEVGECFEIETVFNEPQFPIVWVVHGKSSQGVPAYRAVQVDDSLNIQTVEDLKARIVHGGPVILRINGLSNILKFRQYNQAAGVAYHAVLLIGWHETDYGIRWLIKDSWPNMGAITYTSSDPGIPEMLASGDAVAWQVSQIAYHPQFGVKTHQFGKSWPDFDPESQCFPPELTAELTCWDFGEDRGGCVQVPGTNGGEFTVTWELIGSGGWLVDDGFHCAEVIGSGFQGVLKATVTDSCGRTASDSCHFTRGEPPR